MRYFLNSSSDIINFFPRSNSFPSFSPHPNFETGDETTPLYAERDNGSISDKRVQRNGKVIVRAIPNRETHILLNAIKEHVEKGSKIMSDEYSPYKKLGWFGYHHGYTKHGKRHYVQGKVHTNAVEGLWSIIKNGIRGSYHSISPKHLQSYLDEFSFRYNYRTSEVPVFQLLLEKVVG